MADAPRSRPARRTVRPVGARGWRSPGWLVVVLVVLLAAACSGGSPGAAGTGTPGEPRSQAEIGSQSVTLSSGGRVRSYRLYRPTDLPARAPLVVMLHGGFGDAALAERAYGWDAQADAGHFVVAYPEGINRAWAVGGGCCGVPGRTGVDDVAFVRTVVDDVARRVPIDRRRIYATGISNGGMFAYRLACDTSIFAAIGPVAATLLGPCRSPAAVSVIHIHGTADSRIRFDGAPGDGAERIDGPAVPALISRWRAVDRCGDPTVHRDDPVTTSSSSCPQGRAVTLVTVAGAGHQWPGSTPRPGLERALGIDPPSQALDATRVIWRFFDGHPAH